MTDVHVLWVLVNLHYIIITACALNCVVTLLERVDTRT